MPLVIPRFAGRLLKRKLRGDGKHSPFFDAQSRWPVVVPKVLTLAERDALRRAVGRA